MAPPSLIPPTLLRLLVTIVLTFHQSIATKLSIVIAPSRTVVAGQQVRISCYIDNMDSEISTASFSLNLFCPVFNSRVSCFQNCHNSCADVSNCPQRKVLNTYSCSRYVTKRNLAYEYTLVKANERHSGNYRCSFYGMTSETVKLNVLDPTLLQTAAPRRPFRPVVPKKTTKRPPPKIRPWIRRTPPPKPPPRRVLTPAPRDPDRPRNPDPDDDPYEEPTVGRGVKNLYRTGEKLLFVVILLFIFSLLINSVFLIRCVLIYFYGYSRRKVRMGNILCMNEEIRIIREIKDPAFVAYASLGPANLAYEKSITAHQNGHALGAPPHVIRRQHSADPPHPRMPYHHPQMRPRPRSNQSMQEDINRPRVMRVVSEIELQPGEVLDEETVMYVPLPVVVQQNGHIHSGSATTPRRPLSVYFQPGQEGHLVSSRPRLSTSVSGIDRLRRSSQELPNRMLSIESVFEMETLHE